MMMSAEQLARQLSRPLAISAAALMITACADGTPTTPATATNVASVAHSTTSLESFHTERFERTRGAPVTVTRTISTAGIIGPFSIRVQNGDAAGAHRVSSASVSVDGTMVFAPDAFNQGVATLEAPITPGADITLSVTVAGAPGGYLDISLLGRPGQVFCPDGPAGTYGDLREAVIATPPDGTIFVCDGDFAVNAVLIDRPLTLRSLHSGMATLRDADPNPVGQGGTPALRVNDISSGLVRIVDLNFVVGGSILLAGTTAGDGMWDQVHVDSVRIVARTPGSTASFVLRSFPSSVEDARMEVTNSYFEDLFLAVFAVAEEVNVRNSIFERNDRAMVYSSLGGHGTTEGNTFRGCGIAGCIRVLTFGGITVRGNHIETGPIEGARLGGIVVSANNAELTDILIENNTVIGHRNVDAPADQQAGWADQAGIAARPNAPLNVVVRGNRVSDTFASYLLGGADGATVYAHDNFGTGGAYLVRRTQVGSVVFTRNDGNGHVRSIGGNDVSTSDYRCNWWGTPAGPLMPDANIPAHTYTPWAVTPVAGTSNPCDPTP